MSNRETSTESEQSKMKTDTLGTSTVQPGEEQYESYYDHNLRGRRVQYDYRTPDGKLFSCIAKTVDGARAKRNAWLEKQQAAPTPETLPIPATVSRSFRLSNGCELSFASHQFSTLVSNGNPAEPQIFPGWHVADCIKHFQAVWKALNLTWEEITPDCQIVIDGWLVDDDLGNPKRLNVADATAWFLALMRRFPGARIEVRRDGQENPVLVTAQATQEAEQ